MFIGELTVGKRRLVKRAKRTAEEKKEKEEKKKKDKKDDDVDHSYDEIWGNFYRERD